MDELAAGGRPGPAGVPPQADGQASASTSRVLNAVAERVGWGKPAPQGVFRGLAHMMALRQLCGGVPPRSPSPAATRSRSTASSAATDPGYAVNPAQIERQVAGSFVYGLSALFYGECTVKDGAHRADQLRQLQLDAHRRDAEGRVDRHAVRRRILGRRRRADHLRRGAGRAQRVSSRRPASASARSR